MSDPYKVLGIQADATEEEIKKAYRALSRKYHPDANINNPNKAQAEEKFKEIQQAYNQIMKEREQESGIIIVLWQMQDWEIRCLQWNMPGQQCPWSQIA